MNIENIVMNSFTEKNYGLILVLIMIIYNNNQRKISVYELTKPTRNDTQVGFVMIICIAIDTDIRTKLFDNSYFINQGLIAHSQDVKISTG